MVPLDFEAAPPPPPTPSLPNDPVPAEDQAEDDEDATARALQAARGYRDEKRHAA
jgi:hypothetical protein